MTSGISDPWQSTGFVRAPSEDQTSYAKKGDQAPFGDARTAQGELEAAF
jgi:hypothetical protein